MVSIVILTRNRKNFLKQCLDSIISRTSLDYEIIVVDNASTDGTTELLQNYPKVIHLKLPENIGVIARNKGFEIAKGEYVAQIDDDVVMMPNWLENSLKYFDDPKVGMCGPQGGLIVPDNNTWLNLEVFKSNNSYVDFLTGFYMLFKNIGLSYDQKFGAFWHEELDLSLQAKFLGYRLRTIQEFVCVHNSQRRGDIDWELHDKNKSYVYDKWKDKLDILRLGGN